MWDKLKWYKEIVFEWKVFKRLIYIRELNDMDDYMDTEFINPECGGK